MALQQQVQDVLDDLVASGAEAGLQLAVVQGRRVIVDAVAGVADPRTGTAPSPGARTSRASDGCAVSRSTSSIPT
jgi:CubicO group peptidase (beta-lactamase class C family)